MNSRSNDEWIGALRGGVPHGEEALQDLQGFLRAALRRGLRHLQSNPGLLDDVVQETMLRLLEYLPGFRGDSAFTTWAMAIAMRTGLDELRRRRKRDEKEEIWSRVKHEEQDVAAATASPGPFRAERNELLEALQACIEEELSSRQRMIIQAELRGVPTVLLSAELQTNRNALYKAGHDARKKLRAALSRRGFGPDAVQDLIHGEVQP